MDRKKTVIGCVFLLLFLIGTILMYTVPSSVKITHGLTTETEDGITIYFNTFEPVNGEDEMKAMILGHGGSATKEFLKGYAIEMAAAGFFVITLDFRGHGQSTGEINFDDLDKDVYAIKNYLAGRNDIDIHNLGYLGYSMGGRPGNKVVKEDVDFKCLILVGSGLEIKKNEVVNRDLNVLMIQARYDEAHTLERTKSEMGAWLGKEGENVYVNKLYGNFPSSASKIYLDDNSDHLTLAWDTDFIREARNWVINTFPDVRAPDENFHAHFRYFILLMQIIGGLGVFFMIVKPLSTLILNPREDDFIRIEGIDDTLKRLTGKIIMYSLILGIPGMMIMSWVLFLLPLSIAGLFSMLLFGQAFGILILLYNLSKRSGSSLKEYLAKPFKIPRNKVLRNVGLGIILAIILYVILILTFGLNYVGLIPSIFKLPWVPIYFALILFIMIILGVSIQPILQSKLKDDAKEVYKIGMLSFSLQLIHLYTFIIAFCVIANNYFIMIFLIIATPVTLLCSLVLANSYKITGNIIVGSIITTLIITCLVCTLAPFAFSLSSSAPYLS